MQGEDTRSIMHPNEALFANEAFYLAFAESDYSAMSALWSQRERVVCIHPGWSALLDRIAVLESWERILGNSDQPKVSFYAAQAISVGLGVAVVCYEVLPGSVLTAMNLFITEDGQPRLVHHQSGPCGSPPPLDAENARLDA
jgi:hypothetical protein